MFQGTQFADREADALAGHPGRSMTSSALPMRWTLEVVVVVVGAVVLGVQGVDVVAPRVVDVAADTATRRRLSWPSAFVRGAAFDVAAEDEDVGQVVRARARPGSADDVALLVGEHRVVAVDEVVTAEVARRRDLRVGVVDHDHDFDVAFDVLVDLVVDERAGGALLVRTLDVVEVDRS